MDMELDYENFYCQESAANVIVNDKTSHGNSDYEDDEEDEKRHQRFKNEKRSSITVNFDCVKTGLAVQSNTSCALNDTENYNSFGICKTITKQTSKTSFKSLTNAITATENISTQVMQERRKRKMFTSSDNEKTQNRLSIFSRIKFSEQVKSTAQTSILSRLGHVNSIPDNNAISLNESLTDILYPPVSKKLKVSYKQEDSFDYHADNSGSQIQVSLERIKIGIFGYSNKCSVNLDPENGTLTLFLDGEQHKVNFKINCLEQIREFFSDGIQVSIDRIKSSSRTNIELFAENLSSEYKILLFGESLRNALNTLTKYNPTDLKSSIFSEIVFILEFQNKNHVIAIDGATTLPTFVELLRKKLNSKYIEIPLIYPYSRKGKLYVDSEEDWDYCKQSAISGQAYNPFDALILRILEYLYW
ncbi:19_t:CDS:2 [Ambispora gerdemannii]|uniref:19_t:CDS:1 n=1 Tax=Ambispora gerdemannii TaxID=144530 RepID=A0A9N9CZX7_9GLOM|nr:19_t:CDS:2 [Ambispora gerdemannii]